MRVIIICAGDATRWNNHLGVSKHLAPINGEPILMRTIRLLKSRGIRKNQIFVVSKEEYPVDAVTYIPKLNKQNHDADKFLSSKELWDDEGRTIILYGDVYFSENAIDTILKDESTFWRMFCRPLPSTKYGYPYGECFAVSFMPIDQEYALKNLKKLVYLYKAEVLSRIGGWEWARVMAGVNVSVLHLHHTMLDNYIVIDDETDDMDYPEDYDLIKKAVGDKS